MLSVIVPAFNEEDSIEPAVAALRGVFGIENIDFEVIFVDDGSCDSTYKKITEQSSIYNNVRGFSFSRNFGKEAAILAGLRAAGGDCCAIMDCDLQHPPKILPKMYHMWKQGYEVVEGVKKDRGKESSLYRFFAEIFYRLITALSGLDMRLSSDFKLLDRRIVNVLTSLDERNIFFRGLSFWAGFKSVKIEYEVAPRLHGATKWNLLGLFKYALNNIVGFTTAPLQVVTFVGIALLLVSAFLGVQTLLKFIWGHVLEGFTTVILLLLLIGGSLMVSLGVIGIYIAKIYEEVKGRPRFIIAESTDGTMTGSDN